MTVLLLSVSLLDPARLPMVRYDPVNEDESLLEVLQGSAATVAVIRRGEATKIKVNNYYTLGGSGSRDLESLQGYLPVVLHRQPDSVYMLGLGTGISAGAVLHLPVKQLIVTELLAEVVTVAERYFGRYNNRLFFDSRARVIAEDGRNYLAATEQRFDIIIADLFVPWRAGVGSLYSVEHYRAVRDHLKPGGLFMQWLPAYQLSEVEFGVILRTLRAVFPQLTMWRGDFSTRKPVIGLLAQSEIAPLSADVLLFSMEQEQRIPLLAHYIGDTAAIASRYQEYPINRDDRPVIEYQAPVTQREQKQQQMLWLNGEALIELMSDVRSVSAVKYDGYLSQISPAQQQLPAAGLALHRAQLLKRQGYRKAAQAHFERYQALIDRVN